MLNLYLSMTICDDSRKVPEKLRSLSLGFSLWLVMLICKYNHSYVYKLDIKDIKTNSCMNVNGMLSDCLLVT